MRGLRTITHKKLLLGIDIGTSSIKFSVKDADFREYYYTSIKYKYDTLNKDWTEIDPSIWKTIIIDEMKKIFKLPFSKQIAGICPTAQMHTLVFLDKKGIPLRKAIMWNDRRTKTDIPRIKKILEEDLELYYNANIISTGSPLANLLWLKEEDPENFNKLNKICMCKDYVNAFLTGEIVTDFCDASTSCLLDLTSRTWSEKICDHFVIDINILPKIQVSTDLVGFVKEDISRELSTSQLPVFTGTGDNAATVLATKYLNESELILSLGTSGVVLAENHTLSLIGKNIIFRYGDEEMIISQASLSTGGKAFDWWLSDILKTPEYYDEQEFSENQVEKNEVFFLPYLSGEKYLYKNPGLSGAFYNLSLQNNRCDLNLAILEGVTFALKYLSSKIKHDSVGGFQRLILLGGGSNSDEWTAIVADIFDADVIRYKNTVEAVQGAVIIGLLGLKEKLSINKCDSSMLSPNQFLKAHYIRKYKKFCFISDEADKLAVRVAERNNNS